MKFGQVDPGATRIAEWRFTSSLQGFFDDFKATLQHVDALGSPRLSTVKSVSIHEMTHLVRAEGELEDGRANFLVNDDGDAEHLSDRLYLSNGNTQAVTAVSSATLNAPFANAAMPVTLQANMPADWGYLRIPEPSAGQARLLRVLRSDGREVSLGTNVWTTDRWFPGPGQPPIHEHRLHLFDFGGPGIYTLYYAPMALVDTNPPTSRVKPLAAGPPTEFPVMWEGEDLGGSGVAYFDVLVSEDGGSFRLWLERTALRGSVFAGQPGRSYAFYSVATDAAGNREAPSGLAQSSTVVGSGNQPPVISEIPDQTVAEGERLSVRVVARDPENGSLRFAVAPGAPSGVAIDAVTGELTWQTSESDGGSSPLVTVQVTDDGLPAATASRSFRVQVTEQNSAPSLAPIADQFAAEGLPLEIQVVGTDTDTPSQILTYSFLGNAPTGAVIHPQTGRLTWTPTEEQGPSTNVVTVLVTDNGTPPKSGARVITIFCF